MHAEDTLHPTHFITLVMNVHPIRLDIHILFASKSALNLCRVRLKVFEQMVFTLAGEPRNHG